MITELGKFLRKLRIDENETLKQMAVKLNITPAYLSAIENGKRTMPEAKSKELITLYKLTEDQQKEMHVAMLGSVMKIELNIENISTQQRLMLFEVKDNFKNIDDVTAEKIIKLIKANNTLDKTQKV